MFKINQVREVSFSDIQIPEKEVIRRLGYPPGTQMEHNHLNPIYQDMKSLGLRLFNARGIYIILKIKSSSKDSIQFTDVTFSISSPQVCKMLKSANYGVVFMVTLGKEIEVEIQDYQQSNDMGHAFMLDAIASETADALANQLHHQIVKEEVEKEGFKITPRFSPGYGDWPLYVQPDVLTICQGECIGITLNESCHMSPRKSVSAVFGLEKAET